MLALVAMFALSSATFAQECCKKDGEKKEVSKADFAQKRTEQMAERYGLNSDQKAKLLAVNTAFFEKYGKKCNGCPNKEQANKDCCDKKQEAKQDCCKDKKECSKKYPKLTEIGSKRTETVLPGDKGYDGMPVSGYYTQEEARELVKYAAERFITIIPEIDMPGHIQSALAAYPELGCTGGPYPVCTHFGVIKEVLCAGNPKALQLAKDVVNEIMDIFPSEYIHLGGDECPKDRWKECAKCQQKIKDLNLKDEEKHSKEELLQTWFMGELEKDIRARGRKMIAWDEILDGSPSKTVTVIGWTSKDASIRSARQGHPTVVAPITNFYFSNPRINKIEGIPSIQRVYDLDPCFDVLTPEEQKNIIGAEGCIWTEWVKDSTKLEWQLLPRLAALCEVQWTPKDKRNLDNFLSRMFHMQELYQLKKMNYRKDIGEDVLKSKESKGFFCK